MDQFTDMKDLTQFTSKLLKDTISINFKKNERMFKKINVS